MLMAVELLDSNPIFHSTLEKIDNILQSQLQQKHSPTMECSKYVLVYDDSTIQKLSLIVSHRKHKKEDDFLNDVILFSAVCNWFTNIGEAAKRISKNCDRYNIVLNDAQTELLSKLAKLKDFLTHHYDKVR
jgi:uncharacterized protein with HEPN domain